MKKVRHLRSTALALSVFAACSVQAAPAVASNMIDFEGFTVSWDNLDWTPSYNYQYTSDHLDYSLNYTSYPWFSYTGNGVRSNSGTLSLNTPTLVADAVGANDANTASTSATFSITAKPGWGIGSVSFSGLGGTWGAYNGGSASADVSTENTISPTGLAGRYSTYDGYTYISPSVYSSVGQSGYWVEAGSSVSTNAYIIRGTTIYDMNYNYLGHELTHQILPLAGQIDSNVNVTLTAANGNNSRAYSFAELSNYGGMYNITAYRAITPVPEAETWLMMIAGTGLIGYVLRRRKQNEAAAAPMAAA